MDDFLENLSDFIEKMNRVPSKSVQQESQELLDLATKDLKSSQLLYNGEIYNNAIYYLQQAVEKASKAFHKISGILDDKQIRKTSHNSPELFLRMVEQPWAQSYANVLKEITGSDMVTDTSKAQSVVDENIKRLEIARLSEEQIKRLLSVIPPIVEQMQPFSAFMNINYVTATLRLYILSSLTFPHEQYTRYANYNMKPKEYTLELGIVKSINSLWEQTEIAINEVQQILNFLIES